MAKDARRVWAMCRRLDPRIPADALHQFEERALATLDADPLALLCIAPDSRSRSSPWKAVPIHEIWNAQNLMERMNTCIFFVGDDGKKCSGLLFEQARLIGRQELIARFGAAVPSPPAEGRQP